MEGLFVHVPVENLKVKLIHDKVLPVPHYKSMWDGIRKIVQAQGFRGISRGAMPNMYKEASNHAVRFPLYK